MNKVPNINDQVERILRSLNAVRVYQQLLIESLTYPAKYFAELNKRLNERLQNTFKVIKKIQENHKEGMKIRGEIITKIIDLEEYLEEIILKRYIKPDYHEEFEENFSDRNFSSLLKIVIVNRTGLLDSEEKLKQNIETLYQIRNTLAHQKYRPTVEAVLTLHQKKVTDLQSLKRTFDEIYEDVIKELEKIVDWNGMV